MSSNRGVIFLLLEADLADTGGDHKQGDNISPSGLGKEGMKGREGGAVLGQHY